MIVKNKIMAIKKVWIEEGCTECELCADTCPEVFEMGDDTAVVKEGVDYSNYEDGIIESAEECPVEVIHYEED
jgi:ferredoxin